MNKLIIVGAGAFGREVFGWALDIPADQRDWEVGGFLDNRTSILDGFHSRIKIIGDPLNFEISESDRLICAIGEPQEKLKYCRQLKARGGKFINLIHPTAVINIDCRLGEGCIFCPYTIMSANATLGNFVTLNCHAGVGHDAVLGDGCTLSSYSEVAGWTTLGESVFLGSHACVLPKVNVGDFAIIGAGSVVVKPVKPRTTVFGVPAKTIWTEK